MSQQVRRRLVVDFAHGGHEAACGAHHRLLARDQLANHRPRIGHTFGFRDGGQRSEGFVGAGRRKTKRANSLRDHVDRKREFGVLGLEHEVQGVEHRPGYVPVEIVGLEIERVAVGKQVRKAFGDSRPVVLADANVDVHE